MCQRRIAHGMVLTVSLLAALSACAKDSTPEGVTALRIDDPHDHWTNSGFTRLVPAIHVPSTDHQVDQVEIWAKIPDGASIEEQPVGAGVPVGLVFPPGSVVDRVEYEMRAGKRTVADVRGTRIADDGAQWFHVYRPGDAGLFGLEWARDDTAAHARATRALRERLTRVAPAKGMDAAAREKYLATVEFQNQCAPCHALSRATNTTQGEYGLVNRGTDASGFFTPWTIFENAVVLESYGVHDRSETDRHTTIACPGGDAPTPSPTGRQRCGDNVVPVGTYDLGAALARREPHALAICTGRKYLADRLSPHLRQRFAPALAECETDL